MKKYIFTFYVALLSGCVSACSCGDADFDFMTKKSEYVFIGKVDKKNIFLSFLDNKYKFTDVVFYKGNGTQNLTVWSPKFDMSCGMDFEVNVRYIIFVSKYKDKFWADRCASWSVTGSNKKIIDDFNEYFLPKN